MLLNFSAASFGNLKTSPKQIAIDAVIKAMRLCEEVQAEMVPTDAIQKSVSLWLPRLQHVEEEEEEDNDDEMGASDPISPCPVPYPSRISAAKILIELEQLDVSRNIFSALLNLKLALIISVISTRCSFKR